MKTTYLFLSLLLSTSLLAQDGVDYKEPLNYSKTGEVTFRAILHYPGKSKAELRELAKEWFARKFDGEFIQFDSRSEKQNQLYGRGYFGYSFFAVMNTYFSEANYNLSIAFKEGKIKVQMEQLFILGETAVITSENEVLLPKPAHKVISDEKLYKRNGKARILPRKHKEQVLGYWYELLDTVDGFFHNYQKEVEEDW